MSSPRPIFCTILLFALAFSTACGNSNRIGTCITCPEEQAIYATTNSGEVLTFPFPLGTQLETPTSVAGPENSTGILVWGNTVYVSDPDNSAIRAYIGNSSAPGLSPASVGPFAVGAPPGPMAMDGQTLYVASSAGEIFALTVNADGSLTSLAGSPFTAGMGLSHLAVVNTDNASFLYAANSDDPSGSISAFTIHSDGSLTPVTGSPFATVAKGGPEGLAGLGVGQGIVLYAALKNAGAVAAFSINADGSLNPVAGSPFAAGKGTASLTGCGCVPNGFLFAANSIDGTISTYSINSATGVLTQTRGSPFTATTASGDMLFVEQMLFLPDASSNAVSGFVPDLSTGVISMVPDSPFPAGSGPLALAYSAFPP
jgi:6-phosphogluconolactonase